MRPGGTRTKFKQGIVTAFNGVTYRSRWEVYVAKILVAGGIPFNYEPKRFHLTNKLSYLPDFWLPSYKTFIECKGTLSRKDARQLELFSKKYKILYVGRDEVRFIAGTSSLGFLSSNDIINYVPSTNEIQRFGELLRNESLWKTSWKR